MFLYSLYMLSVLCKKCLQICPLESIIVTWSIPELQNYQQRQVENTFLIEFELFQIFQWILKRILIINGI